MLLIDTHAHLDDKRFEKDLSKVIARAEKAGIKSIINNGINIESNRKTLEIAGKYEIIKPALGFYPLEALKLKDAGIDAELKFIEKNKGKIAAIGEIGLDFYWNKDKKDFERQKKIFSKLLKLAEKINKPVIVHSRGAEQDCFDLIKESKVKKVVMHCFGGSLSLAKKIEEQGRYFSIPCIVIRSRHFQDLVKQTNINQLLTETDAPYLPPFPGKRNEPAFIAESIKKIAELKGFTEEETANNIFLNYEKLFK